MKPRSFLWSLAMVIIFAAIALTEFVDNVRAVQVIGLLVCGAGIGVSVMRLIAAVRQNGARS